MPPRPPSLKARPKALSDRGDRKQTTTERGYGWKHQQMRERVLTEEPLCRMCWDAKPRGYTQAVIADHIIPLAEGGTADRENYQPLCKAHSDLKSAGEAKRGRGRSTI